MKITTIKIKNFRLLKDFEIDLEKNLSLVIGKNNSGKTSFLSLLNKLLASDRNAFNYDDFNLDIRKQIIEQLTSETQPDIETYEPLGIRSEMEVEYADEDNLAQVSKLIMSLDPENKLIVLEFDYTLSHAKLIELRDLYIVEKINYNDDPDSFLRDELISHIEGLSIKSVNSENREEWIDLKKEKIQIKDVIGLQYINAKREVTNQDSNTTLSAQTAKLYRSKVDKETHKGTVADFKKVLRNSDKKITEAYTPIFESITRNVADFGGHSDGETIISITSELQHSNLLEGNTTVSYSQDDQSLPEQNNGLGYMNLISIIFDIEMLIDQLKPASPQLPAPINLLFIEEPEAHTHPQMQYVFINNIKTLLGKSLCIPDLPDLNLQTVVSTHSSHIVAESDFEDIKYLKKDSDANTVVSKNLSDLRKLYGDEREKEYRFLKQYLTLNRSEVFFADKLILIEGDTERILLPAMMKKLDTDDKVVDVENKRTPLLSQNVSMIEVGAHSQIYAPFIDFLSLKTLIITDLDSGKYDSDGNKEKCPASDNDSCYSSNYSLLFYHGFTKKKKTLLEELKTNPDSLDKLQLQELISEKKKEFDRSSFNFFKELPVTNKTLIRAGDAWQSSPEGNVLLSYQTKENEYHARSFEDAFFNVNTEFVQNQEAESQDQHGLSAFPSLTKKWLNKYVEDASPFELAEYGVDSKPSLAMEILLQSDKDFSNWNTPDYIKEGLVWLKNN
ncbi:AAA family ATPase [Rubritalea sp.]|uniref:AAA family ATPase n=1 Tax=Rubritalea sp. TaxID=2109375 RepID=UPI003EF80095